MAQLVKVLPLGLYRAEQPRFKPPTHTINLLSEHFASLVRTLILSISSPQYKKPEW